MKETQAKILTLLKQQFYQKLRGGGKNVACKESAAPRCLTFEIDLYTTRRCSLNLEPPSKQRLRNLHVNNDSHTHVSCKHAAASWSCTDKPWNSARYNASTLTAE